MTFRLIEGGSSSSLVFPLFDSILDRTAKRQFQRLVTYAEAKRGQVVARQGEPGRELLMLADGVVKLWKALPDERRQIVAFRASGDLISLHRPDTPWPVNAQAVSSCRFLKADWSALRRFAKRYPAMDRALPDIASDEIAGLQDRLLMLGRKTVEEKLASFILEFCRPSPVPYSVGRDIHLPMRRSEIAEFLGLTTESVSREFTRLKRERIIAMPRPSRIVLLDRPALEVTALGNHGVAERLPLANTSDGAPDRPAHFAGQTVDKFDAGELCKEISDR